MMSDTYGLTSETPFTRYDPDTQSWRTCQDTSLWDLQMSSPTLPKSGGMRNGELTERPTLEPRTAESAYLSLPTPLTSDANHGRTIHDPKYTQLRDIMHILPTPTVMDMGSNYTPQEWEAWKQEQRAAHNNGNGHGASLTQEALTMLPTPTAQAAKHLLDDRGEGTPDDSNLWSVAGRLLPTPTTDMGRQSGQCRDFGADMLHALTCVNCLK